MKEAHPPRLWQTQCCSTVALTDIDGRDDEDNGNRDNETDRKQKDMEAADVGLKDVNQHASGEYRREDGHAR